MYRKISSIFRFLFLFGCFLLYYSCKNEKGTIYDICQEAPCIKSTKKIKRDPDSGISTVGIDTQYYLQTLVTAEFPLKDYHNKGFNRVRQLTLVEGVKQLKELTLELDDMSMGQVDRFQKDLNKKKVTADNLISGESNLRSIISIYDEKGVFDCENCQYRYQMVIQIPKDPVFRLPEEIRNLITRYLRMDEDLRNLHYVNLENRGRLIIDLSSLVVNLSSNKDFSNELLPLVEKYRDVLRYFDFETQEFIHESLGEKIINFPIGEYRLNLISSLILDQVYAQYEDIVNENPGRKYNITCIGYADQSRIRSPIHYSGSGAFSQNKQAIAIEDLGSFSAIAPDISSNVELSYARSFTGAEYTHRKLQKNTNFMRNENLKVYFQGKGVDPSATNRWKKRRIELHIEEQKKFN